MTTIELVNGEKVIIPQSSEQLANEVINCGGFLQINEGTYVRFIQTIHIIQFY